MIKNIAVYFDKPESEDYPFSVREYRQAYHELATTIVRKGGTFAVVRTRDSYGGGKRFVRHWMFDGKAFQFVNGPLRVDMLFLKGDLRTDAPLRLLNHPEMESLLQDKWECYRRFPDLMARTHRVESTSELEQALHVMDGPIIVAKPLQGYGGQGIIIDAKDVIQTSVIAFPYLLQEYIDTSAGIPGIIDGPHDFRIIGINGVAAVSYIRTPPPGTILANVAKGGQEIEVPIHTIPPVALALFRRVDTVLAEQYPRRIFSVDMGRDRSGTWRIIELNNRPGLSERARGHSYTRFQELLTDALLA